MNNYRRKGVVLSGLIVSLALAASFSIAADDSNQEESARDLHEELAESFDRYFSVPLEGANLDVLETNPDDYIDIALAMLNEFNDYVGMDDVRSNCHYVAAKGISDLYTIESEFLELQRLRAVMIGKRPSPLQEAQFKVEQLEIMNADDFRACRQLLL